MKPSDMTRIFKDTGTGEFVRLTNLTCLDGDHHKDDYDREWAPYEGLVFEGGVGSLTGWAPANVQGRELVPVTDEEAKAVKAFHDQRVDDIYHKRKPKP